jgi:hypothetical protein
LESSALEGRDALKKNAMKDHNETLSTLKMEECTAIKLPDYADRLIAAGKNFSTKARWFPFAYEVIILQWSSILIQQRAAGEKSRPDRSTQAANSNHPPSAPSPIDESVAAAAARSIGVAVAGAPMLFEVIKQSLGFRISTLFREVLATTSTTRSCPPLVTLDETLLIGLEQVSVLDVCWRSTLSFRQNSHCCKQPTGGVHGSRRLHRFAQFRLLGFAPDEHRC